MTGRVLYAGLELLDHQLRDRSGRLCGNVDDLELQRSSDTGELYVTAFVAGPGALLQRMGRRRLGGWMERTNRLVNGPERDRNLIPFALAARIGPNIDLAVDAEDLATFDTERWVRDHVIGHLPGNRHRAPE
jgi:hypothetical protein